VAAVAVTGVFQFGTDRGVVEDLAVINDLNAPVFVGHWLAAGLGEVNDAQTAVSKVGVIVMKNAIGIRPAVPDGVRHALQQ